MSYGSDLLNLAPSATVQAGGSLLGSVLGAITAGRQAKKQFKYNQALMQQQHQYELENMSELERIHRGLALDSSLLRREALERAGYNAADPEGTGTVVPSTSGASTSASGGFTMPGSPYIDMASGISAISNAQLTGSQARLNDIEAQYRARKLGLENQLLEQKIKEIADTLPERVNVLRSNWQLKQSQLGVNDARIEEICSHVDQLAAQTQGIRIDNKYKDQLNQNTIDRIHAETVKLLHEGNIKAIEEKLASVGILIGSNWMTQLLAAVHLGSGSKLMNELVGTISGMIGELPGAIGQVLGSVFSAITDSITTLPEEVIGNIMKSAFNVGSYVSKRVKEANDILKKGVKKAIE